MTRICVDCGASFEGREAATVCPDCCKLRRAAGWRDKIEKQRSTPTISRKEMADLLESMVNDTAAQSIRVGKKLALAIAAELRK